MASSLLITYENSALTRTGTFTPVTPAKGVNQILEYIARYALSNIQKQLDVPLCALTRRKTLFIVSFVA